MLTLKLILVFLSVSFSAAQAKLGNNFAENKVQYGEPIRVVSFPGSHGFTGYATYILDKDWQMKVFFKNDKSRSEHLVPSEGTKPNFNRSEVKHWAEKMFQPSSRGLFRRQINMPRVEGHFFDKGMVAYELKIDGKKTVGYQGIKVLFYDNDHLYSKINPKAYL